MKIHNQINNTISIDTLREQIVFSGLNRGLTITIKDFLPTGVGILCQNEASLYGSTINIGYFSGTRLAVIDSTWIGNNLVAGFVYSLECAVDIHCLQQSFFFSNNLFELRLGERCESGLINASGLSFSQIKAHVYDTKNFESDMITLGENVNNCRNNEISYARNSGAMPDDKYDIKLINAKGTILNNCQGIHAGRKCKIGLSKSSDYPAIIGGMNQIVTTLD